MHETGAVAKRLRVLECANTAAKPADVEVIQHLFPNLETLAIGCSAAGARVLCNLSLPKLRRLKLDDVTIKAALMKTLFNAPWASQIETLNLRDALVEEDAFTALVTVPNSERLRVLSFGSLTANEARTLAETDALEHLECLAFPIDDHKPTLKALKQRYGLAYDRDWSPVVQTLGGFSPEFFPQHPICGIA